jgi:hypothetical protein
MGVAEHLAPTAQSFLIKPVTAATARVVKNQPAMICKYMIVLDKNAVQQRGVGLPGGLSWCKSTIGKNTSME